MAKSSLFWLKGENGMPAATGNGPPALFGRPTGRSLGDHRHGPSAAESVDGQLAVPGRGLGRGLAKPGPGAPPIDPAPRMAMRGKRLLMVRV